MSKKRYEVVTHIFRGGRFDDHGIDVDVLPDLIAFKNLLVATAKELWRRGHPDRQRLPGNFEESLSLKFYKIEPGSAAVPLVREVESEETLFPREQPPDELDEAAELIAETIGAASENKTLPPLLPKNIIPYFADYGKTLREDESIELKPAKKKVTVHYSSKERSRLSESAQAVYEDIVDLIGEIRLADLDGGNFALRLADGSKIYGKFSPEQEATITDALREHTIQRLHIKGRAEFFPDGTLKKIVSAISVVVQPAGAIHYDENAKPIWKIAEEISATVPDEEWAKLPTDLSKNLDHYLYGKAKEQP